MLLKLQKVQRWTFIYIHCPVWQKDPMFNMLVYYKLLLSYFYACLYVNISLNLSLVIIYS